MSTSDTNSNPEFPPATFRAPKLLPPTLTHRHITELKNRFVPHLTTALFILIGVNSFIWWFVVLGPLLFVCSIPITPPWLRIFSQRCIRGVVAILMYHAVCLIEVVLGTQVHAYGDVDRIFRKENALFICNHPTWFDFLYLFSFMAKYSTLSRIKIIPKKQLQGVPYFGWVMQLSMYLFLVRDWANDRHNFISILNYYRHYVKRYQLLMFPEGTALSAQSIQRNDEYAAKQGMKPLAETLQPRTLGFVEAFMHLTRLNNLLPLLPICVDIAQKNEYEISDIITYLDTFSDIDAVYNFTIYYQNSRQHDQNMVFLGTAPHHVHIKLEKYEILSLVKAVWAIDPAIDSIDQFQDEAIAHEQFKKYGQVMYNLHVQHQRGALTAEDLYQRAQRKSSTPNSTTLLDPNLPLLPVEKVKLSQRIEFEQKLSIWLTELYYHKDRSLRDYYNRVEDYAKLFPERTTPSQCDCILLDEDIHIKNTPSVLWIHRYSLFLTQLVTLSGYYIMSTHFGFAKWVCAWNILTLIMLSLLNLPMYQLQLISAKLFDKLTSHRHNHVLRLESLLTGTMADTKLVQDNVRTQTDIDIVTTERMKRLREIKNEEQMMNKRRQEAHKDNTQDSQHLYDIWIHHDFGHYFSIFMFGVLIIYASIW